MAKHNFTTVKREKFEKIVAKLGLKVVEQTANLRVEDETGTKRFYIPRTTNVHRIDISGFTSELAIAWEQAYPDKKAPTGHVKQVIDFSKNEEQILRAFYKIAKSISKVAEMTKPEPVEAPVEQSNIEPVAEQATA